MVHRVSRADGDQSGRERTACRPGAQRGRREIATQSPVNLVLIDGT